MGVTTNEDGWVEETEERDFSKYYSNDEDSKETNDDEELVDDVEEDDDEEDEEDVVVSRKRKKSRKEKKMEREEFKNLPFKKRIGYDEKAHAAMKSGNDSWDKLAKKTGNPMVFYAIVIVVAIASIVAKFLFF